MTLHRRSENWMEDTYLALLNLFQKNNVYKTQVLVDVPDFLVIKAI